jgi:hypothetical protein
MFPSGQWDGFWVQEGWGRQAMTPFFLHFAEGRVEGKGKDIVGRFVFTGEYDTSTGQVRLVKQYLGRHRVLYVGQPDGEGSILGKWYIGPHHEGPFMMRPMGLQAGEDEPIQEMG